MTIDYKRYPLLYVDDEPPNLVTFRYSLEHRFTILTAASGPEAIEILRNQDIAVLLADQRMPGMSGVELCAHALAMCPDTIRVMVTAYADAHDAIAAINQGRVSQYLHKPWTNEELVEVLEGCLDLVHVQRSLREIEQRMLQSAHVAHNARHRVAHDLRNPIQPLLIHLGMAKEDVCAALAALAGIDDPRAQQARKCLREAERRCVDARHACEMVLGLQKQYLVDADARPAPESTRCDAARVVDSVVRVVRDSIARGTEVRVVLNGMPMVNVPEAVLGQIVLNLVTNAAHAVDSANPPERVVTVAIDRDGAMVILRLADTGVGIRPEHLSHIFEPYFTTKPDGVGLGLCIVRELVERAGGTIRVESAPNAGATFEVRLPAAQAS